MRPKKRPYWHLLISAGFVGCDALKNFSARVLLLGTRLKMSIYGWTLDKLMTKYVPAVHFNDMDSPLFAFASYNAGPGKVQALRKEEARRGFDPDKWFNNVEIVAIERIGMKMAK